MTERPRNGACSRWQPPLDDGTEWWMDRPEMLTDLLDEAERRGLVERAGVRTTLAPGWHGIRVRRLAHRPSRRRVVAVYVWAAVSVVAAVFGVVWSYAVSLPHPWASAVVLAITGPWAAVNCVRMRQLDGHRGVCLRPRCRGCRGR